MYDLNYLPIHRHQGQPIPQLPGFQMSRPPRRATRSRSEDLLMMSLILKSGDSIPAETQQAWLNRLSQTYFKTSGSVTSALRSLIETLNLTLMEKNLKLAKEGRATTAAINMVAVHRRHLYIVQSGLAHAFTLNHQGLQHFSDTAQTDRGLGFSRSPAIRYYQADLGTGAYLFMTDTPPATWTEEQLISDGFPSLDQLRRRLLHQASPTFRLDLVQITPGEGLLKTTQPVAETRQPQPASESVPAQSIEMPASEATKATVVVENDPQSIDLSDEPGVDETQKVESSPSAEPQPEPQPEPKPESPEESESADGIESAADEQTGPVTTGQSVNASHQEDVAEQSPATEQKFHRPLHQPTERVPDRKTSARSANKVSFKDRQETIRQDVLESLALFFGWWRKTGEKANHAIKSFYGRLAPESDGQLPEVSRKTMIMIAVIVPLVVVGIAVGVYLARGRSLQHQFYFQQAEVAIVNAAAAEDPAVQRDYWVQALSSLEEAENFRRNTELIEMRRQVMTELDRLDGAVRLSYHPAIIGSLPSEIEITRIVSFGPDLYMLDGSEGRVLHATRGSQGYEVNVNFICGMGNFSGGRVDRLVDMAPLPLNNPFQAHIIAADAIGNVVFCGPGQDPIVQSLPVPETVLGEITRIAYEGNFLYTLNPAVESVRVYLATNWQFLDTPREFFGGEAAAVRPRLTHIVDLAVNGTDLYLLQGDGQMVSCTATGLAANPVNCENPVTYVDGRPGKEEQSITLPANDFTSVIYTAPPDPSISIFDAATADIYRLSLRFRLHQRLRPELGAYEVNPTEATAFTIGIDRIAFIAFGNQVFYAYVE